MKVPASSRLEELVAAAAPNEDYVAYVVSFDPVTATAVVNPAPGKTSGITVGVTATMAHVPTHLLPGVRVHVRRFGQNPPVVTDVLALPPVAATLTFHNELGLTGLAGHNTDHTIALRLTGFTPDETVKFTVFAQSGSPVPSAASVVSRQTTVFSTLSQVIFYTSVFEDGTARLVQGGLLFGVDIPAQGVMTLRATGMTSGIELNIPMSFRFVPSLHVSLAYNPDQPPEGV